MRSWWDILDVTQDADLPTVKRAYAGKLKSIRQDEDPAGFMELREAYEHGRANAQYASVSLDVSQNAEIQNQDSFVSGTEDFDELSEVPFPIENETGQLDNFIQQAERIIQDKNSRGEIEAWKAIFVQLDDLDIDEYTQFERTLQYVLGHHSHRILNEESRRSRRGHRISPIIMEKETGRYIFDYFGWNNPRNPELYSEDMMNLRNLLNAHSEETRQSKVRENHAKIQARERATENPMNIWVLVIGGVFAIKVIVGLIGQLK